MSNQEDTHTDKDWVNVDYDKDTPSVHHTYQQMVARACLSFVKTASTGVKAVTKVATGVLNTTYTHIHTHTSMGAQQSTSLTVTMSPRHILVVATGGATGLSPELGELLGLLKKAHERYAVALVDGLSDKKVQTRLASLVEISANVKEELPCGTKVEDSKRLYAKQETEWVVQRFLKSLVTIDKEFAEILAGLNGLPSTLHISEQFKALAGRPPRAKSFIAPYERRYSEAVNFLTATLSSLPEGSLPPKLTEKVAAATSQSTSKKEAVGTALEEIRKIVSLPSVPTTPVARVDL